MVEMIRSSDRRFPGLDPAVRTGYRCGFFVVIAWLFAAVVLLGASASAAGKPDLVITSAKVVCMVWSYTSAGTGRFVKECSPKNFVEVEITVKNVGDAEAVLSNGMLWNLVEASGEFAAFASAPYRQTYVVPQPTTPGYNKLIYPANMGPFFTMPAATTYKLAPGGSLTQMFVLVPDGKLTGGCYNLIFEADPQCKLAEANEDNNRKIVVLKVVTPAVSCSSGPGSCPPSVGSSPPCPSLPSHGSSCSSSSAASSLEPASEMSGSNPCSGPNPPSSCGSK